MILGPPLSQPLAFSFTPRLDNSLLKSQVTVSADPDDSRKSRVYFPAGSYVDGTIPCIILTTNSNSTLFRTPAIEGVTGGFYITVDNSVSDADFILGLEYQFKIILPSFYVSEDKKADRRNIPMVENVYLDFTTQAAMR